MTRGSDQHRKHEPKMELKRRPRSHRHFLLLRRRFPDSTVLTVIPPTIRHLRRSKNQMGAYGCSRLMLRPAFVCQTLSSETLFGVSDTRWLRHRFCSMPTTVIVAKGNLNRRQQTE